VVEEKIFKTCAIYQELSLELQEAVMSGRPTSSTLTFVNASEGVILALQVSHAGKDAM
jgi:hypothetical protein